LYEMVLPMGAPGGRNEMAGRFGNFPAASARIE
jgi:hypothetical protein